MLRKSSISLCQEIRLQINIMITIKATHISNELIDLLNEEKYLVHSCFDSGCNLRIGNILCFIGNKYNTKVPYGILLREYDVIRFVEKINPDVTWFRWDAKEKRLVSSEVIIDAGLGESYNSSLLKLAYDITEQQITLAESVICKSLVTGFDMTIEELLYKEKEKIQELYRAFKSNDKDYIELSLKKWIGRGKGLTPSGDDFLQGILFVNEICPILSKRFKEAIEVLIEKGYTTDISKNYFASALQGLYTEPLLQFYKALEKQDVIGIRKSVAGILRFGHTSGVDIAAGLLAGIIYLKE